MQTIRRLPGCPASLSWLVVLILLLAAPRASAQTIPYILSADFSATNLNLWGSGGASTTLFNKFVGLQWNTTRTFGGITEEWYGDYGLEATVSTSGNIGFDVYFKSTSGSVNLNLPNTLTLNLPDLTGAGPADIVVNQNRSLLAGQTDRIQSTFPTAEFSVDAKFQINASVKATAAFYDSVSGSLTLNDVRNAMIPTAPIFAIINPFNISLPIVKYNVNNDHKIELLGGLFGLARKDLGTGFTYPLNTDTLLPGGVGYFLPTKVEYGNISVATITQLDARSGGSAEVTNTQQQVITVRADLLGLVTLAYGLPLNPFNPRIKIPGTPISAEIDLVSIDAGIALGLEQKLKLTTNSYLILTSNMPVQYEVPNSTGSGTHLTGPVTVWYFPLPEDGSDLTVRIHEKPSDPTFQIFPSVEVRPTVANTLNLLAAPTFHFQAFKVGLSVWGIGGGIGPIFSYDTTADALLNFNIFSSLNDYRNSPFFSGDARSLVSLVNPGAGALAFDVPAGSRRWLFDRPTQSYHLPLVAGSLTVTNSGFDNLDLMEITGLLRLNGNASGYTTGDSRGLLVGNTGVFMLDAGSIFDDLGKVDANYVYLTDANGKRIPGFVDENGNIASGTFVLGGVLTYHGADVTSIGANATMRLVDSTLIPGDHLKNGPANALAHLARVDGTLWLDGEEFVTDQSLQLEGNLILRLGSTFSSPGLTGTTGFVDLGAGSVLDITGGPFGYLSAGGVLSHLTASLGDPAGGAQFRYAGPAIVENGADLVFLGARPVNGFLARDTGGQVFTDALAGLALNTGTLSLLSGATQNFTGSLVNTGVLFVRDASSALTTGGTLTNNGMLIIDTGSVTSAGFANGNSLSIANGGVLHAGALADRDGSGILGGGGWLIHGTLDYTGGYLTGLGATATLVLNGAGATITNSGLANPLAQFASNAGTLAVTNGATFDASDAALTNSGLLQLTGTGSTLRTRGFASQSGELQLGLGTTFDTTGGAAALADYWTTHANTSLPVNGSGQLSGGVWTIAGDLVYTGPALTGVAAGTTLTLVRTGANTTVADSTLDLNSGSKAFVHLTNGSSPVTTTGLTSFNMIDGVFALSPFANFSTDQSLNIGAAGRVTVAPRATLEVKGLYLNIAAGGILDLQGNLILAGTPSSATVLTVPDGFAFAGSSGGGEVQLGRITIDAAGNYQRTGYGLILSPGEWTNANYLIRGMGALGGTTFLNNGRIYAAEGNLNLSPTSYALINTGYLGSVSNGTLSLHGLTVTNQGTVGADTIYGLFDIGAAAGLTNTTIAGGDLYVGPGASLQLGNAALNVRNLTSLGTIEILAGTTNSFGAELKSLPGTSLLLRTGSTLVLDPNQPFVNRGLITLESGATLTGAPLSNDGTFTISSGGTTALSGLANLSAGTLGVVNGGNLKLVDAAFTNAGLLTLAGENPASLSNTSATLTLGQSVTLSGGGIVQLGGFSTSTALTDASGNAYTIKTIDWGSPGTPAGQGIVTGLNGTETLTNVDNSIQGRGNLGNGQLAIVNGAGGTIRSLGTAIGGVLDIQTGAGGFRNQGTLTVDTNTTMRISGGPFLSLSSGAIVEGNYIIGGTLQLPGVTSFDTSVNFVFNSPDSRIIDGIGTAVSIGNILAGGGVTVSGGAGFQPATTSGFHFNNAGLLAANPGGLVQITGGYFDNFNGTTHTLTGGRFVVNDGTLRFTGADIRTNASDLTLGGASGLLVNESNQSALRNFSLNSAGGLLTFNRGLTLTLGSNAALLTNLGRLTVASGATVTVPGPIGKFANADATGAGLVVVETASKLRLSTPLVTGFNSAGDATHGAGRYILGGTLQLDAPFTTLAADLYTWGDGRITDTVGALSTFSTLSGLGTITVANGTFDLSASNFTNNSLIQVGSATARNYTNTVQDSAGTLAFHGTNLGGPGTLRLHSTAEAASSVLFDHSFTLNSRLEGNGELHVQNATDTFTVGSAGVLAVTGTGNTITLAFDQGGSFINQGLVLVGAGGNTLALTGGNVAPDAQIHYNPSPGYPGLWALSGNWDVAGTLLVETLHTIDTITAGSTLTLRNGYNLYGRQFSGDLPVYHPLMRLVDNAGSLSLYNTSYAYPYSSFGTITNSGTITLDHSDFGSSMTVNNTTAGTLRIAGSMVNYSIMGPGDIHYYGSAPSQVAAAANPVYTGRTIIEDGATLEVYHSTGLGTYYWNIGGFSPDSITLGAGSTLHLKGITPLDFSRGVTFANGATITADYSWEIPFGLRGTGDLTLNGYFTTALAAMPGNLTLNGNLFLPGGDMIGGALNGSGAITTSGLLVVVGDSNFSGQIIGNGANTGVTIGNGGTTGSLNVSFNNLQGFITFDRSGSLTYSNSINDGVSVVVKGGLDLTFASDQAYTGSTTITSGSGLTLGGELANYAGIVNNGRLTFAQFDGLTLGAMAGTGTFVWDSANTVVLTSLATYNRFQLDQGTLQFGDGGAYAGSINGLAINGTLAFNSSGNLFVNPATLSGPGSLEHLGTGTLTLGTGQTYAGATFVGRGSSLSTAGGGILQIGADSSLGTAPATLTSGHLTIDNGTLVTLAPVTLAATRGVTIADGGATFQGDLTIPTALGGSGALTKSGGGTTLSLVLGGVIVRDLTVNGGTLDLSNGGGASSFSSSLSGAASSLVRFSGAGTTTFNANTSYAGHILIAPGTTLAMGSGSIANSFEAQGTLVYSSGTTAAAPFGAGLIAIDTPNFTPFTLTPSAYGNFTGSLDLRGGILAVNALDSLLINPASLNAGAITFNGGTLRQTGDGHTGPNQGLLLNSDGIINLPGSSDSLTVYGPIGGSGILNVTGLGTLNIQHAGTIANHLTFTDATLEVSNTTDLTLAGQVTSNSLFVVNNGPSRVIVTLAAFLHDVLIASGTLQIGNGGIDGMLGASGAGPLTVSTLAGGSLAFAHSDNLTFTAPLTGTGGLKQLGSGTLTINTAQAFTGALVIEQGTLRITDTGSVAGNIVTNANLLLDKSVAQEFANVISGTGKVTLDDTVPLTVDHGTITLSGANTYSGRTDVKAGTLIVTAANPGNGGANVSVGGILRFEDDGALGGTINLAGDGFHASSGVIELAYATDRSLAASFTGTGLISKTGAGTVTLTAAPDFSGFIDLGSGGALEFSSANDGKLAGEISGAGNLVMSGTGTLILSGQNSFSGTTTINLGVLQLGDGGTTGRLFGPLVLNSGGTLGFNRSDMLFQADVISGDGAVSQRGTGTLVMTGNHLYTGGTSIASGSTLQLGYETNFGSIVGNVVNNGTLVFDRDDDYTFAGNSSGSGTLVQTGTSVLTLSGLHTATGGATIHSGSSLALGADATLTGPVTNSGNLTILTGPAIRDLPVSISGTGGLTVAGGGGLRITGDLTYGGTTTLADHSTLLLVNDQTSTLANVLAGNGNFAKLGTGTLILTADSDSFQGTVTLSEGTLQLGNGGTTGSIGSSVTNVNLEGGTLAINHSDAISIASAISGQGGIAQLGSGRLWLTNDNTFLGDVHVAAGSELQLGLAGATGSVIGHLDVDGLLQSTRQARWDINLGLTGSGTISKTLTGNSSADVISIAGGAGSPINFTGHVSFNGGTVGLYDDGIMGSFDVDHLEVFGANVSLVGHTDFTHTLVTNGTITLGNGGTSGSLDGDITGTGTLAFNRSDTFTYDGIFSGGALRQVGSGTTVFHNGNSGFGGDIQIDAGTLALTTLVDGAITLNGGTLRLDYGRLGDSSSIGGTGRVVTASTGTTRLPSNLNYNGQTDIVGGTLEIAPGGGTSTLGGLVTGSGGLRVASAGTLVLAGGGTFTGATELVYDSLAGSAPTLQIGGGFASAMSGYGTIEFNNSAAATASGDLSGALALLKTGAGRLTLTGQSTHTGITQVDLGVLRLGANNSLSPDSPFFLSNVADVLLELAGYDAVLLSLNGGGTTGGNVSLGSGHLTFAHSGSGYPLASTYAGNITGTGGIIMNGYGTQTLTGQNSYTGGTTVLGGTLVVSGSSSLGLGTVLLDAANGGQLRLLGDTLFDATRSLQLASAGGSLLVDGGATATVNTAITGSGAFYKQGAGTLLLNATPTNSGLVQIMGGTLVLGGTATLNSAQTLVTDGYLDLNGRNWSTPLNVHGTGGVANSSATATTVSGTLDTWGQLSLRSTGGGLNVTGAIASNSSTVALQADGTGRISLGAAPAATIASLTVDRATLALSSPGSFSVLTGIQALNGAQLELTGGSSLPALTYLNFLGGAVTGDAGGLQNTAAGTSSRVEVTQISTPTLNFLSNDPAATPFLLGGAGDLTLSGRAGGYNDIAKVGNGRLTLEGNFNDWTGGFDVRAGTLAVDSTFLQDRALKLGATGSLDFGGTGNLSLTSLTGDGTLALGAANLTLNAAGTFSFAGALTTTGTITKSGAGTATLTNVTAGSVFANEGTVRFTGNLGAASLTVRDATADIAGSLAAGILLKIESTNGSGKLIVDAARVTTNGGATFSANLDSNAMVQLRSQSVAITTNSGSITARSGMEFTNDDINYHNVFSTIVANTGTLRAIDGGSMNVANGFTNTGTVLASGAGSFFGAGSGNSSGLTQAGGSFTIGDGATLFSRTTNITGGTFVLNGSISSSGGVNNTLVNLSGGSMTGHGGLNGRLTLSGGTFSPGNSPGTFEAVTAVFAGGGNYLFEINNATGTAGTNWDLLSLSNALTISATSGSKFTLTLMSLLSDNTAGAVLNFNNQSNYTYTFASGSSIVGFDANAFAVNTSGFVNPYAGTWSVAQNGGNLNLVYTAIPEPGTYAAIAGFLALGLAAWRRRRRA